MPQYDWTWGSTPPLLKRHSQVKHALLREYLIEYFLTLVSLPQQDRIQLTIVDGFSGGGLYVDEDGNEVPGSPLVILQAIKEAEARVNLRQGRRKPIVIDAELICIDESAPTLDYLRRLLSQRGYGNELDTRIHLLKGLFADHCSAVVKRCQDRSRKSGRAIFVLDQYGYTSVPMHCLGEIFAGLRRAEVILTFYIDALLNFLSAENLTRFERGTGFDASLSSHEIDATMRSPKWRVHLQSQLYQRLIDHSGAKFYTPFFVRPERGHGDFWLVHLSQHWKARDVMATTHWSHNNHFAHYGEAGFHMFSTGYVSKLDDHNKLQMGFDFSDVAATVSKNTMIEQIPGLLSSGCEGKTVESFFLDLINTTPATRSMVEAALLELHHGGEIRVVDGAGDLSRARVNLKPDHVLKLPDQRAFLF
jgi:three-Cys-motif partner protein